MTVVSLQRGGSPYCMHMSRHTDRSTMIRKLVLLVLAVALLYAAGARLRRLQSGDERLHQRLEP